jgi:2-C-methyl-D-erythritol 4-phosphate cytidylyltransferase
VILWSLVALVESGCRPVVVAFPEEEIPRGRDLLSELPHVATVAGGETRQASVAAALEHVTSDRVLVHDAARPFLKSELVKRVTDASLKADGAIAALPAGETVKSVVDDRVVETVDRDQLWLAQTPQVFTTTVLKVSHRRAEEEGFIATDDAQLVERYGGTVVIVEGDRSNIKITYPEDLILAEAMAQEL